MKPEPTDGGHRAVPPSPHEAFPLGGPSAPSRPPSSGRGVLVALVAVLGTVVVAAAGVLVVIASTVSLPELPSPAPETAAEEAAPKATLSPRTPRPSHRPDRTPSQEPRFPAMTPGWTGVPVADRDIAYDVPGDWMPRKPSRVSRFGTKGSDPPPGGSLPVSMNGVAEAQARGPSCWSPGEPKPAAAGVREPGGDTDAVTPAAVAERWATAVYGHELGDAALTTGPTRHFRLNGIEGRQVKVSVEVTPNDCYPDRAEVRVVTFPARDGEGSDSLIVYADAGGPLAPGSDDLDTIISSLRPLDPRERNQYD